MEKRHLGQRICVGFDKKKKKKKKKKKNCPRSEGNIPERKIIVPPNPGLLIMVHCI